MKNIFLVVLSSLTFYSCISVKLPNSINANIKVDAEKKIERKKLHHTVGFKFKEGSPLDSIKKSAQNTLGKIELYAGNFKYGDNNVSSIDQKYARGHQHILHVTFWSEYDRDSLYMPHPLHIQFGTKWGKYVDEIVVFDVWEK